MFWSSRLDSIQLVWAQIDFNGLIHDNGMTIVMETVD